MLKPRLFFFLLFALTGGVFFSIEGLLNGNRFAEVENELLVNNDGLSGSFLGRLKEQHGFMSKPYDVGIFGSSTSMMVTARDLGFKGCRFFNFAVLGESLRNSVVLLERLSEHGNAPKVSLIGLDNFEIQSYGNSRTISFLAKVREFFRDIFYGIKDPSIGLADLARMTLRHLIVQKQLIQRRFNFELLTAAFGYLFDAKDTHPLLTTQGPGFRKDGSYNWKRPRAEKPPGYILTPRSRAVIPGYLRYDLSRLAELAKDGKKIFLFEMALEPANADYFAENPSPIASKSRKAFLAGCREFGLACFPAPKRLSADPEHWQDLVHSPPAHLGSYLKRMVPPPVRTCRSDL